MAGRDRRGDRAGVMDQGYAEGRRQNPPLVFRYRVRARVVCQAARKHLSQTEALRVLDFGSAEGLTLLELNRLLPASSFDGLEYSDDLLACVPELPDNIRVLKGDVTELPGTVRCSRYDIVSALALLEHLPAPVMAVREAAAVLRPGGLFVATCPNPFWDRMSSKFGLVRGEFHASALDKRGMIEAVTGAGLELVSFEPFMWAPISMLPYFRIPVAATLSLTIDRIVRAARIFNWGYVNQCVVARKP